MLVTLDVIALFTNTPQEECAQATEEALSEEPHGKTPTNFLVRILKVIQELNIFEFNGELWKQLIGSAMGQRHVPPCEDIYMARKIDIKIAELSKHLMEGTDNPLKLFKRYLDDIFLIFIGSSQKLHMFLEKVNEIHPNIQFTMSHTSLKSENDYTLLL